MIAGNISASGSSSEFLRHPWLRTSIADKHFIFKWQSKRSGYSLLASDFCNVWLETLEDSAFLERIEELNSSIEAPIGELLALLQNMFDDDGKKSEILAFDSDCLHLCFTTDVCGVSFCWKFYLSRTSHDSLITNLTLPFFAMVDEQQRRCMELHKIIKRKDQEIQDYILGGASLINKRLETKPFDEAKFLQEISVFKVKRTDIQQATELLTNEKIKDLYLYITRGIQIDDGTELNEEIDVSTSEHKEEMPSNAEKQMEDEKKRRLSLEQRLQEKEEKLIKKRKKQFKF